MTHRRRETSPGGAGPMYSPRTELHRGGRAFDTCLTTEASGADRQRCTLHEQSQRRWTAGDATAIFNPRPSSRTERSDGFPPSCWNFTPVSVFLLLVCAEHLKVKRIIVLQSHFKIYHHVMKSLYYKPSFSLHHNIVAQQTFMCFVEACFIRYKM